MCVNLTPTATSKLSDLIAQEQNPKLMLRIFVSGGGCSGFQYGFTFDEKQDQGDQLVESGGVKVLVDPISVNYLRGATIDYREDLNGASFVINNPNAGSTCGCGSSFSPKESGGGCGTGGGGHGGGCGSGHGGHGGHGGCSH
ncbi:MAG: iron-sulfur cluster insertion protein ErpA [Magnetococcus sp. WYHC-3]